MTKEQLSLKILKSALIIGVCGGVSQALGNSEYPTLWMTIGLFVGLLITLQEWQKVAIILIAEYKRLKKLEAKKNTIGGTLQGLTRPGLPNTKTK